MEFVAGSDHHQWESDSVVAQASNYGQLCTLILLTFKDVDPFLNCKLKRNGKRPRENLTCPNITISQLTLTSPDRLRKIDQLRERNISTYLALPQLVAVSDKSSGKSSLLENLTGIPFPRGQELCTRYSTQITHRRDAASHITISIIPGPTASLEHKEKLQDFIIEVENTDQLHTEFPDILNKVNTLMDIKMPRNPSRNRTFSEDILKIERYRLEEDYLTVIDMPSIFRITTQGITTDQDRLLVERIVKNYISDNHTIMLAVLPYNVDIATQEILAFTEKADLSDIFKEEPWTSLPDNKARVNTLQACLQELLSQIADRSFPKLRSEARRRLNEKQDALDADYLTHELFADDDLRLIRKVVNTTEDFSHDFEACAHTYSFEGEPSKSLQPMPSPPLFSDGEEDAQEEEARISKKSCNILDLNLYPDLEGLLSQGCTSHQPAQGIMSWITQIHLHSQGVELERQKKPYMLNHYFNENLQKAHNTRTFQGLKEKVWKENEAKRIVVNVNDISLLIQNRSNREHTAEEIHNILQAYYKVARKRFVDNVYYQAVDHCLLSGPSNPLGLFCEQWVLDLSDERLRSIAGETRVIQEKRQNLQTALQDLAQALEILG
ncbi:hypothetical protein FPSE_01386 [Fusarium pseudograminearum CS3096]|uniref:GED domain-containing protein n=1 Tax=Fusarium pseudograminearum (strain CS3096) TaxID=1028729 RepID=K3VST6_FUSPC|nr:hypothetical protein FPSE_01386 [Fusarium pseudograminearum CS3096]EKJ78429.1 hypothetical protein FPSE_01386 [Fusarium pseudograminearum CS3096]